MFPGQKLVSQPWQVQALKDKVLQSKLTEARRSAELTSQCPDPDLVERTPEFPNHDAAKVKTDGCSLHLFSLCSPKLSQNVMEEVHNGESCFL